MKRQVEAGRRRALGVAATTRFDDNFGHRWQRLKQTRTSRSRTEVRIPFDLTSAQSVLAQAPHQCRH